MFPFGSCLFGQLTVCSLRSLPPLHSPPRLPLPRSAQPPASGPLCSPLTSPTPHPGSPAPADPLPAPGLRRRHPPHPIPPELRCQGQRRGCGWNRLLRGGSDPLPCRTLATWHQPPSALPGHRLTPAENTPGRGRDGSHHNQVEADGSFSTT